MMSLDVAVQQPLVRSLIVALVAVKLGLVEDVDALVLAMPPEGPVHRVSLATGLAYVRLVAAAILAVVLPWLSRGYYPVIPGWQFCKS